MKKILVIDDEPEVAGLMKLFFNNLGYEADIFLSSDESIRAIGKNRYWAVFCDYMMPGITGDKLYGKIKDVDCELAKRFVIVTGAVLDEGLNSFLSVQNVKVMNKPFRFEELKEVLTEVEKI